MPPARDLAPRARTLLRLGGALAAAGLVAASAAGQLETGPQDAAPDASPSGATDGTPEGAGTQGQAKQRIGVDIELVLAVDVSQSMDPDEHQIQRAGYSSAFRHEDVIEAILGSPHGRIAVTYMEWGDSYDQLQVVPWTLIDSREAALAFADALDAEQPFQSQRTSISRALYRAADLLDFNEFDGEKRVVDISGDGPNNVGPMVETARDALAERGIVVNGLPIMLKEADSWYDIPNLDKYYQDCVITGPGAFVAPVDSLDQLANTIRAKLVLEIVGSEPRARIVPAQLLTGEEGVAEHADCLTGERLWQSRGGRFVR